jgi:hypothetical protein
MSTLPKPASIIEMSPKAASRLLTYLPDAVRFSQMRILPVQDMLSRTVRNGWRAGQLIVFQRSITMVRILLAFCAACFPAFVTGEEKTLLSTSFEGERDGPAGWAAKGSAVWAPFARTGQRSIEIRSWRPDPDLMKTWNDYNALVKKLEAEGKKPEKGPDFKTDTRETFWLSDPFQASGQPVKLSFWGANNIVFMNDESFHAEVGLVPCRPDGTFDRDPAARAGIGGAISAKPLHFYREQRENHQLYARAVPDGLAWRYQEAVLKVNPGTYRAVLHFQKEPDGQVWVDDLVVSESADYRTGDAQAAENADLKETLPWQMEIHFPVSFQLFLKGDPLEMDLALFDKAGLPKIEKGMKLVYEIRDYSHRWVHGDTLRLEPGSEIAWKAPDYLKGDIEKLYVGYQGSAEMAQAMDGHTVIVPLSLSDSLKAHEGKVLFIRAELLSGRRKLAADEVTFGIIVRQEPAKEDLWRGGKVVNFWGPEGVDIDRDFMRPDGAPNGFYYKAGAQWNTVNPMRELEGLVLPKEKGGALPPEPAITPVENHGHLWEYYSTQSGRRPLVIPYTIYAGWPKWAVHDDPEFLKRYSPDFKWMPDIEVHAAGVAERVRRLRKQFPNALAVSPTAGEGPFELYRTDLQQATYKAVKAATPDVPVGVWGEDPERLKAYKDCWDFLDGEFYADPRFVGKELPRTAAQEGARRGQKLFAVVNEGCALSGSEEQPEQAKGVFDFHVFQWRFGVKLTGQFEFNHPYMKPNGDPLLRDALHAVFGGTGHFGGAQRLKLSRYDMKDGTNIRKSYACGGERPRRVQHNYAPHTYQPALPVLAAANVVRSLDSAQFERDLGLPEAWAFQFERLDKTVLFFETFEMNDITIELSGIQAAPCETLDIYGDRHRLEPAGNALLLTVGHYPLVLMFDRRFSDKDLAVRPCSDVRVGMTRSIVRKSPGIVTVDLGPERRGDLSIRLDPRLKAPDRVAVKPGKTAEIQVKPQEERPTGAYRTYIAILDGPKALGLLSLPLRFESSSIEAELEGTPMTKLSDPALRVTVKNLTGSATTAKVRFRDDYTTEGTDRPSPQEKSVKVAADGRAHVEFPLNRHRVKLNHDYPMKVTLALPGLPEREIEGRVHFRGVPRRTAPITVDGDLSDWPLDDLLPLEPDWLIAIAGRGGGVSKNFCATWDQQTDPESRFKGYFLWDETGLYFAATIRNTDPHQIERVYWNQDCFFLDIYPGKYIAEEGTAMRPYVMHMIVLKDGSPGLFDKNGKVWPAVSEELGAKFAGKRVADGYTYEYFMDRKYLNNLRLEPGAGFSASMVGYRGEFTGLGPGGARPMFAFYRNCFDFDGGVKDMARFILTEK